MPETTEEQLIKNLRNLGHKIRFAMGGRDSQDRILTILLQTGTMTQSHLTEHIGIRSGSASEVIGKLESAGLIVRTTSSEDRRTADIRLTEAGRERAEEVMEARRIHHQEMLTCLSDEEKEQLLALTQKLNEDWNRRYSDSQGN